MHKSALLCLVILITFGLLACIAGAADISGFKKDESGNLLDGWEITLYNESGLVANNTTIGGLYLFENLDFGNYTVNETPQCGWLQISGDYIVELNVTNSTFTDLNFTNQQQLGNYYGNEMERPERRWNP